MKYAYLNNVFNSKLYLHYKKKHQNKKHIGESFEELRGKKLKFKVKNGGEEKMN